MSLGDLTKWFTLKPQQIFAICAVAALILFLPDPMLEQIGVKDLRDRFRPWIGGVFILSLALLLSQMLFSFSTWVKKERKARKEIQERLQSLHNLTSSEKKILNYYIKGDTKTQFLSANGVVGGLQTKGILYQSSQFGRVGWSYEAPDFSFNISDWAWNYLKENPKLLEEVPKKKAKKKALEE
jgi:hypothetical protein